MPYYCIQLDVKNLLVEMDGVIGKYCFFANRFVEADDATAAEQIAIQDVQEDDDLLTLIKNDDSAPPAIDVEEAIELQSFEGISQTQGRVWYSMHTKRWWQFWKK